MLDGLEIFDEDEEIATDDFLADRAAPDHLPKAPAPDGHLPTAMGQDDGSPVGAALIGALLGLEMMRRVDPSALPDALAIAALRGVVTTTTGATR